MSQAQTTPPPSPLLLFKSSPDCSGQSTCLKPWMGARIQKFLVHRLADHLSTGLRLHTTSCYPPSRVLSVIVISSRIFSRKPFCVVSKHLSAVPAFYLPLPLIAPSIQSSGINDVASLSSFPSSLGTTLVLLSGNNHRQTTWNMPGRSVATVWLF